MLEDLDLNSIADDRARDLVQQLFNRLEDVMADLQVAQEEIQRLRNEIARRKREQGQPTIKPNTPAASPKNHSSEQERHTPKGWAKGCKTAYHLKISIPLQQRRLCGLSIRDKPLRPYTIVLLTGLEYQWCTAPLGHR